MVARLNRPTGLPQITSQRVDEPVVQRAVDAITRMIIAVVNFLQPFAQPEKWHLVGYSNEPAFGTNWQNYTGGGTFQLAAFRKNPLGRVEIRGLVERTGGAVTTIFVLPQGYRPAKQEIFFTGGSTGAGRVDVQADGQVVYNSGGVTYFTLSGITFDTEG